MKPGTRRLIVPEVVQTSMMDCGPASLSALLEGFGVRASFGRLREACQTEVDGTSIDTLEEVLGRLGFDAEQVVVPPDHLLMAEAKLFPAIMIVRLPDGATHFIVAWRTHGPFVQVMDPAVGRRWMTHGAFMRDVYMHAMHVPAAAWGEWATSDAFLVPLRRQLLMLGVDAREAERFIEQGRAAPDAGAIAALDASVRLAATLRRAGAVRAGAEARDLVSSLCQRAREDPTAIPERFWSAAPAPADDQGEAQVKLRGAVLVRVRGLKKEAAAAEVEAALPTELSAALREPPFRPLSTLARVALRGNRLTVATTLAVVIAISAVTVIEALVVRTLIDGSQLFRAQLQRVLALAVVITFFVLVMVLELGLETLDQRRGRGLELSLRTAFLEKMPKLGARWFRSRPASDLAERAHNVHRLRTLPSLVVEALRSSLGMVAVAVGIALVDRASLWPAAGVVVASVTIPLLLQPALREREHRMRTHAGAMLHHPLDALLGAMPIRAHVASSAVRREHEAVLVEWTRCARSVLAWMSTSDAVVASCRVLAVAWFLVRAARGAANHTALLLVTYWMLYLGVLGQRFVSVVRQYAPARSVLLRVLEPLGAPDLVAPRPVDAGTESAASALRVDLRGLTVVAGGHVVLQDIDVAFAPGEHVAIVGGSGEGKSTLVGAILGLFDAASGEVLLDGSSARTDRGRALLRDVAWVDPSVCIWNASVLENILYGSPEADAEAVGHAVDLADLLPVIERLPDGMRTPLGEGGRLVSGGEGQRVRLARAVSREGLRLVVLDEAFRGLETSRRRELVRRGRRRWKDATLLSVTHDVHDTLDFPRVIVVAGGRIVEDGDPARLAADERSHYAALLRAERELESDVWKTSTWRRVRVERGVIAEEEAAP